MKTYIVSVSWSVCADMCIEAKSLADAKKKAEDFPLPDDGEYIDGSFEINNEMTKEMNSY